MEALPLFHRILGQPVLVLGAGEAAEAKRRLVEEAGGRPVAQLEPGVRLAFVALDEGAETAAAALREAGCLVNVVDRPGLCDFTVPAIVDRAPVTAAVGTGGASASLSKALKERLELLLPAGLGAFADAIAAARGAVASKHATVSARRGFWAGLLAPGAPLDPIADAPDPDAVIAAALAGDPPPAVARVDQVRLGPMGAAGLTLADLRLLAGADLVVHEAAVPAAVLALARRDAARMVGSVPPLRPAGRVVLLLAQ
jgi:uroporphyrin-III C-methyltransferase/precorrin-2 dehydrogenase/sirohydrochlorin ferrochelatase